MFRPERDWIGAHEHYKDLRRAAEHQGLVRVALEGQFGQAKGSDKKLDRQWRRIRAFTQLLYKFRRRAAGSGLTNVSDNPDLGIAASSVEVVLTS